MTAKANRYDDTRAWYAISTYGGHEDKVADSINQRVGSIEMKGKIFGAIVPKEKQIEIKNGKSSFQTLFEGMTAAFCRTYCFKAEYRR